MNSLRKRVFEICYKTNNPHLASSLSCLDIIENIYKSMKKEDVFVLSKGHGCPAWYAVLEKYGYKPKLKIHPDIDKKNGIICTTGSLGHGLPIALGIALSKKVLNQKGKVYVLLGDTECQEGTTWESILLKMNLKLHNLNIIIDNNEINCRLAGCKVIKTEKEYPHVYRITKKEYEKNIR